MGTKSVDVTIKADDQTKTGFAAAEESAASFGDRIKETLNKPFELLKGLLAVELVRLVGDFFKSSVEAAVESETAWSRVAQSVENAGITFGGVSNSLKATFEQVSDGSRFTQTRVADAFGTLLNVTGDYAGSVKNLALVTDIAIARHMDLDEAATLVGRVMDGNTSMLKRYGIVIKDGADAMQQLHEKFDGFSGRDSQTLEGRLAAVSKQWEEFRIAVGEAVTSGDGLTKTGNALVDTLKHLGDWVHENQADIAKMVENAGKLTEFLLKLVTLKVPGFGGNLFYGSNPAFGNSRPKYGPVTWEDHSAKGDPVTDAQIAANAAQVAADKAAATQAKADKDAEQALQKRLQDLAQEGDLLAKSRDLTSLTASDREKLVAAEMDLLATARDTTKSTKEREAAQDALNRLRDADLKVSTQIAANEKQLAEDAKKGVDLQSLAAHGPSQTGTARSGITVRATAAQVGDISEGGSTGFGASFSTGMGTSAAAAKELTDSIDNIGVTLGGVTKGALTEFVGAWSTNIETLIVQHGRLGEAIVLSTRKAIGGSLIAKGQETLLDAAKSAAEGIWPPNPALLAQAAELFGVGSAEIALGSAFGGAGGGGAGVGGGGGGGLSPAAFQQQLNGAAGSGGKVTVVLPGKKTIIDTTNPDDLNALKDALQTLVGTRDLTFLFDG